MAEILGHAFDGHPAGTVVQFRRVRPGPLNRWIVAAGPIPVEHGDALLLVDASGRSDPDYYEPSSVEPATARYVLRTASPRAEVESLLHNPGPGHFAPPGDRRWAVKLEKNALYGRQRPPVVEGPGGEDHVVEIAPPLPYADRRFDSPDLADGPQYSLDEALAAMRVAEEHRGPVGALLLALPPRAVLRVEGYSTVRRVR